MKKYSSVKTSIILFSLLLFVSSLSLPTFSQTTTIPFNETIVSTTPQSISNHVYYLSLTVKGFTIINGTSVSVNITSITGYISALGLLPPLPLNGVPLTPPQAIGDNIYFAYVPGVSSISNLHNITETYLAYANYTNGSWHVKNVITKGIISGIFAYNNSLYALWKPSQEGETYLLSVSQNNVIKNISINISNASYIEVGKGIAVISNSSSSLNLQSLSTTGLNITYYVINLSTGKVIYKIPDYNGNHPILVSVSNDLGLVSYTSVTGSSTGLSYLVLYNLSTGKIISEKSFYGTALGYINGKFILAYDEQVVGTSGIVTLSVYNLTWGQLYQEPPETISPTSLYSPDGLFVNSSTVSILLTQVSQHVNIQTYQVTENSSLKIINVFQVPKPFTIKVSQQHYPGYTLLNISWNENQSDTYLVYINNTPVGQTKNEFFQHNVTENGTYLIKVIAENPLGEVQENITVNVTVYPVQIVTTTTTTTSTTTSTTTTTTSTTTTSTAITSSTVSPPTTTTTSSTATTSHTTTSFNTTLVLAIVLIVVIVIVLVLFLAKRK